MTRNRGSWMDLLQVLKKHDDCGGQGSNETIVMYDHGSMTWLVGERGRKARPSTWDTAKWWLSG